MAKSSKFSLVPHGVDPEVYWGGLALLALSMVGYVAYLGRKKRRR